MTTPTLEQATAYQSAFDYFNTSLFGGNLPHCLLNFSRDRRKGVLAFYAPRRWEKGEEVLDEISLTPTHLKRSLEEVFASLVHEMLHLWQYTHGSPSRRSYHNREFAKRMLELGLQPKNGRGGVTGQRVSQTIISGGSFQKAFQSMPEASSLPWRVFVEGDDAGEPGKGGGAKAKLKVKYSCPSCGTNVWGKPDLKIRCGSCSGAPEFQGCN